MSGWGPLEWRVPHPETFAVPVNCWFSSGRSDSRTYLYIMKRWYHNLEMNYHVIFARISFHIKLNIYSLKSSGSSSSNRHISFSTVRGLYSGCIRIDLTYRIWKNVGLVLCARYDGIKICTKMTIFSFFRQFHLLRSFINFDIVVSCNYFKFIKILTIAAMSCSNDKTLKKEIEWS